MLVIELSEILSDVTYVGIVDLPKSISLVQHSTKLYLADHSVLAYVRQLSYSTTPCLESRTTWNISSHHTALFLHVREELFYQLGVRQFGDFGRLHLNPPPSVRSLLELSVACEDSIYDYGLSVGSVVDVRPVLLSPGHTRILM